MEDFYDDKARELANKMYYTHGNIDSKTAKVCAIIAVDEIIKNIDATMLYHRNSKALSINKDYWIKVKGCINKL